MSGEIQVKRIQTRRRLLVHYSGRRSYGWVAVYSPTNREITNEITTREYAEDLAQNAQYHLDNYATLRCDNGYLKYSDRACEGCKSRRWSFITQLIEEGVLPPVVETKHCDCLLFTPACEQGRALYKEAVRSDSLDDWERYTKHMIGEGEQESNA